jgi:cytochrome c peroxidase
MTDSARRGAFGVFTAAVVVFLSVVLASQAPPPPPPQGRGQPPPPPPPGTVVSTGGAEVFTISRTSRGGMAEARVTVPFDNPLTEAKVELGRRLFFDSVLSKDRSVSCATCHKPELAFADDRPIAVGIFGRVGRRHSPSLVNRGLGRTQFWDGRAATLEDLALQPLRDANEMDLPPDEALLRLTADPSYVAAFQSAFGRPASTEDMARALATFVRVIRSENSPFDRFLAGDTKALTDEQQRGFEIFRTKGRCGLCHSHSLPNFTDDVLHNTGVAWKPDPAGSGGAYLDDGQFAVTKVERQRGSFKTPTLREIARTAPYMHDGSLATLADVVDFYNNGGRPNPNLFPIIRPLGLTPEEKQALVKFMEALSGDVTSTMLARERTAPDLTGTWTLSPSSTGAARTLPAPWGSDAMTIAQSQTTFSATFPNASGTPRPPSLLFFLNGAVIKVTDRSRPAGLQRLSRQASWRDWTLVLTTIEPVTTADGTVTSQEVTAVLTLEPPSKLIVELTRKGPQPDSWTATYQKR